jgi:outer membrane lipoprotein-sorting protein
MTTPDRERCDDVLARAEEALRRASVPEGPSEEAVARILAALQAAAGPRPPAPSWRGAARWLGRSAAAAILAVGLCYIVATWLSRPAWAFAEVAQRLRDARTLTYRTTMQAVGEPAPVTSRVLVRAPALIRCEAEPDGTATVFDAAHNRTLVLDPTSKSAVLLEGPAPADGGATDMAAKEVEELRKLAEARSEPVGRRRIGDVDAEGFRVRQEGQELLVWVDPGARLPLRVDLKARVNDIEVTGSIGDFQIDPPLDDALFRFEPPAGYTLTRGQNAAMSHDEAIVDMLRTYAEHAEGRFPPRLDDWVGYAKRLPEGELRGATNPKAIRLVQMLARVQVFLLERAGDYGYRPEGVKLGDVDKVLFWYRRKGSAGYRAIYGDLHAEDVAADQLSEQAGPRPPGRPE